MENEFSRLVNALPGLVWTALHDGSIDFFNQHWSEYTGLNLEESCGSDWQAAIHPEDLPRLLEQWRSILASGQPGDAEARLRRFDGEYRWFLLRSNPLRDTMGQVVKWCGVNIDIEDRKRAEWLRAAEMETLQMIADGASLKDILNHVCTSIDLQISPWLTSILLMGPDGKTLWPGAGPRVPHDWARAITPLPVAADTGLCGTAAFLKTRVIVPDVATEPVWREGLRGAALKNRIRAGWSQPILTNDNQVLGTFAIYSAESRRPTAEDLALIEAAGRIALIAIERQRSQEALRNALAQIQQSEAKLRQVIDTIPALAWCNLPDGPNEFLNKGWHEYTGLSPEESHGWGWQAAFHPEDLPPLMEKWVKMLASGEPDAIEARLRRHDGVYRWFLIRAEPFRDEAGNIVRWYGTSTDIDDRKRAEEKLRRSETFLAEGQHLARIGNFSWRVATDEITWSEELYRMYELEVGVPVTLELIRTRVHPEDLTLLEKMVEEARSGGNDFEWQYRLLMPDNSIKYLHAVAHAIQDQDDQLEYLAAIQDVTARRLTEEARDKARSELAQVARVTSLGILTASIAHEVNQPLSGIVTNASTCLRMLSADPPNIEGARETARRTIRDGNRASDVMTRLRALFSKKDVSSEAVDLNDAAQEVIALSSSDLQRNRVVLRAEFTGNLPPVTGDRVQLQQVILNLLRNASDAMSSVNDRLREVLIRTERDEGHQVRLSVKDVGVGFAPEVIDKLFDAFYTTKNNGMGIGLSVSRSIVENHQGRLWASLNDGPGATFCFSIPCRTDASTAANSNDPMSHATDAA